MRYAALRRHRTCANVLQYLGSVCTSTDALEAWKTPKTGSTPSTALPGICMHDLQVQLSPDDSGV
jgi:hypothetical protein